MGAQVDLTDESEAMIRGHRGNFSLVDHGLARFPVVFVGAVVFVALLRRRFQARRKYYAASAEDDERRIKKGANFVAPKKWIDEQERLKLKLITHDVMGNWSWNLKDSSPRGLKLVGGVDISFVKGDARKACACLVILSFPEMTVLYKRCEIVYLDAPYIPGFLAFRECKFLVRLVKDLAEKNPTLIPQVILVDGNGVLHHRGFGLASHLGVLVDIPTVGIGKNLLCVDGLTKEYVKSKIVSKSRGGKDGVPLIGTSGRTWGQAVCLSPGTTKPIYVSIGTRISLKTALRLARACSRYRVPEPVRQADLASREFLRDYQKR